MSAQLWLVSIHEDDWDYDNFDSAAVWADSAAEAERIVRTAVRVHSRATDPTSPYDEDRLWIEDPRWRLEVTPAPTEGIALIHWHAG